MLSGSAPPEDKKYQKQSQYHEESIAPDIAFTICRQCAVVQNIVDAVEEAV